MDTALSRAHDGSRPQPEPWPTAFELHREARRQRSAAIGDLLVRLGAWLRRPWARRPPRAPVRRPAVRSICAAD